MNFKVLEIIADDSFNLSFVLEETKTRNKWVGKICKKLIDLNLDFEDLDERAFLAGRLAKYLNINVPESFYITKEQIQNSPLKRQIINLAITEDFVFNDQKILITQHKGESLPKFLETKSINEITNKENLIKAFVFNLWIGNYDKKNEDYVVLSSGEAYSIDYNLCGPGFRDENNSSLGFCACKYSLEDVGDTGYAIGEIFRQQIIANNYKVNFFEEEISKIEKLTIEDITPLFNNLTIQRESTHENINQEFIDFLMKRKALIRNAINDWCNLGYPKQNKNTDDIATLVFTHSSNNRPVSILAYDSQFKDILHGKYYLRGQTDYPDFVAAFDNFPWLDEIEKAKANPGEYSPMVSVIKRMEKTELWVSVSGYKNNYSYLVGYVNPKTKKGLLGLGKEKTIKNVEIYKTDDKQQVKDLFKLYFNRNYDQLQSEIKKLKKLDQKNGDNNQFPSTNTFVLLSCDVKRLYLERITYHSPILMIMVLICIAALLSPTFHFKWKNNHL